MNRNLFQLASLRHQGLYAPESFAGPNEDIQCADRLGISRVITGDTPKHLSLAIFLMHRITHRTGTGGVDRVYAYKQNTVLLRELFDPVEYMPICPRRHGLAKTFSSASFFPELEVVQLLNPDYREPVKGQKLDRSIDELFSLLMRAPTPAAAGLSAPDLVAYVPELSAVVISSPRDR